MAKASGQVTKIYQLKTLGYADLSKELDSVAKKFETIKKAKLSAQGKLSLAKDIAETSKYSDELAKLVIKEQELRVEQQQLQNDLKAINLQRQIDLNAQKQRIAGNKAEAGSISEIRKDIKELNSLLILKNQKGTSTIDFRGEILSIDEATAKLKGLIAAEQEFRRQFQKDQTLVGEYTTGIIQAFKQVGLDDLVGGQITKAKDKLNSLNSDFDRLQKELQETRAAGSATETIEKQMIENRNEVIKLDTELARLKNDLRGTGDIGSQITTSLNNGFKSIKGQVGQFALQFLGLQVLFSKITQGIENTKLISDQTTDLEIQLNNDTRAAENLVEALKSLNTRTTLAGLQEIANTALKAGTTSKNILDVTEAIDKTKVAFGKDFGSVEEGTETFAKLINIFFEDREITGQRILGIGNAVRTLANETVASVPFLNDFAGRMAGVRQISNVTLPDILGLGAGFEEFKQSAEVSSTVLVKLIPQLAANIEKFAAIAGLTDKTFKQLLTDNPAEALIKVAEGFVKGRGDVEEFANTLKDSGIEAGRAISIIGTLGGKADVFRERIKRAGETINETGAITDAFNKKNTNLASTMDKVNKKFLDIGSSRNFQVLLLTIANVLAFLTGNLQIVLPLILLAIGYTNTWAGSVLRLSAAYALQISAWIIEKAQLIATTAVRITATTAMNVYTAATIRSAAASGVAAVAYRVLAGAIAALTTPIGAAIGLIVGFVTVIGAINANAKAATLAISQYVRQQKIANEIHKEAIKATSDQRAEATLLVSVVKDLTVSEETRLATLNKLIAIDPVFQKSLQNGKINYDQLNASLNQYNDNLIKSAELEASRGRVQRETQKLTDITTAKQDIEFAIKTKDFSDLDEKTRDFFNNVLFATTKGQAPTESQFKKAAKEAIRLLNVQQKEQEKVIDAAIDLSKNLIKERDGASIFKPTDTNLGAAATKQNEVDIEVFKKNLENINKQIESYKGTQKGLEALIEQRDKLQEKLNNLLGKDKSTTTPKASRLTPIQKDAFKDIEAIRDKELAEDELKFQKQEINEEQHLKNILAINQKAIDAKLKVIKGGNAEERKQIAELQLERITKEKETNKKLFDLEQERLKIDLDNQIKNIQDANRLIQQDPTISEEAKAQAKLDADNKILQLQIKFNADIDALEKKLNQQSLTNAKEGADAVRKTKQDILDDERDLLEAQITDIRNAGDKERAQFNINYEKLRQAILNNDKLTASQRKKALEKLAKQQNFTLISSELAQLTIEFKKIKEQYDKGL